MYYYASVWHTNKTRGSGGILPQEVFSKSSLSLRFFLVNFHDKYMYI